MSLLANSNAIETGGYQISRSVRLRQSASAYFNRTFSAPTNNKKWTFSCWLKRSPTPVGTSTAIFEQHTDANNRASLYFDGNDTLNFYNIISGTAQPNPIWTTTQVFRDPSAWYSIVLVWDSDNATAGDRTIIYVNGTRITSYAYAGTVSSGQASRINSAALHNIGRFQNASVYYDGYLTEINFIDGQALTPSSFGETDTITGSWVAKKYTGSYGTNGFYLNFSDNSAATSTTIGKDYSGNGNNFTPVNISVTAGVTFDSMIDVPSGSGYADGGNGRGNYCTLNPLANTGIGTLSNGNLTLVTSTNNKTITATMALPSSGQYYFEITATDYVTDGGTFLGLVNNSFLTGAPSNGTWLGFSTYSPSYTDGTSTDTNGLTGANATQDGDIWCIAVDVTNGKFWIGRSRSGSLTWADGITPAVNGSGATTLALPSGTLYPMAYRGGSFNETYDFNFGQRSTGFAHTPPTGFKALNTQNLPTPTIGATSTTQAGKYFNPVLYTGNGSTQSITGVGFQPDFVWIKGRSAARFHILEDAVRGATKDLYSNSTGAEATNANSITAFNSNGFSIGTDSDVNTNTESFVAWNWKANGTGVSNTAGTITSTVSANTTSGFSIVTYTGTGANATVGHGLGVAPSMIMVKRRNSTGSWDVYHVSVGNTKALFLNQTASQNTDIGYWNNTSPTSTVFTVGTGTEVNQSTGTYVAYCFSSINSYSSFGSFVGNGSATDGPFVFCGFRPRFVMVKRTDAASNWRVWDTSRSTYNVAAATLLPNSNGAELTTSNENFDILSNGFKLRNNDSEQNASGGTYIYAAFAENPLKFSNAR